MEVGFTSFIHPSRDPFARGAYSHVPNGATGKPNLF